jgi:hypothetical protein
MYKFKEFIGRVEDIEDPLEQNRVRVRCYGFHTTDLTQLPTDDLLWANVIMPTTTAGVHGIGHAINGLQVGSEVIGFFVDGEKCQQPIVTGSILSSLRTNFTDNTQLPGLLPAPASSLALYNQSTTITSNSGNLSTSVATPADLTNVEPGAVPMVAANQFFNASDPHTIGNLNQTQLFKLKGAIAYRESRGVYNITNTLGFVGKYQFGYAALRAVKFCNSLANSNADLQNDNVWVGKLGVTSLSDWLTNEQAQELAMDELMEINYNSLLHFGIISHDSPAPVVAGYVACAQFGVGACIQLKKGIIFHDGYGASALQEYQVGYKAVGGV